MKITLYHAPMSCSLASRLALVECGLPHEVVVINTIAGAHRSESFGRINPLQRLPVLDLDGRRLRESSAILPLIADLAPDAQLMPRDPADRATVQSWIGFISSELHPSWGAIFYPERFTDDRDGLESVRNAAVARLTNAYRFLEQQLSKQEWLTGRPRICDFYLAVLSAWRAVPLVADRLPPFPRINALQEALFARPRLEPIVKADLELRARFVSLG